MGLSDPRVQLPRVRGIYAPTILVDVRVAPFLPGDTGSQLIYNIPGKLRIRPHLIAPLNGTQHRLGAPLMLWTETSEADYYEVHVARDIEFTDRIARLDVLGGEVQHGWPFAGTYYWKVRAVAAPAYSDYSEVWRFTIPPLLPDQIETHDDDGRARLLSQFQEDA